MSEIIYGCTNPYASNYNENATVNDGSCTFISGCTNSLATNYNPNAVIDDNSCECNNYTVNIPFNEEIVVDNNCEYFLKIKYALSINCNDIISYFENNEVIFSDYINNINVKLLVNNNSYNLLEYNDIILTNDCDIFFNMYALENQICLEEAKNVFSNNCILEKNIKITNIQQLNDFKIQFNNIHVKHDFYIEEISFLKTCTTNKNNCFFIYKDIDVIDDNFCPSIDLINFYNNHVFNFYKNNFNLYPHNLIINSINNVKYTNTNIFDKTYYNNLKLFYDYYNNDNCDINLSYHDIIYIYKNILNKNLKNIKTYLDILDYDCFSEKIIKNNFFHQQKFYYQKYKNIFDNNGNGEICYEKDDCIINTNECENTLINYSYYNNNGYNAGSVYTTNNDNNNINVIIDDGNNCNNCDNEYNIISINDITDNYELNMGLIREGLQLNSREVIIYQTNQIYKNNILFDTINNNQSILSKIYYKYTTLNSLSEAGYIDSFLLRTQNDDEIIIDLNPNTVLTTYPLLSNQYNSNDFYYSSIYHQVIYDTIAIAINEYLNTVNLNGVYEYEVLNDNNGNISILFYIFNCPDTFGINNPNTFIGFDVLNDNYNPYFNYNTGKDEYSIQNPILINETNNLEFEYLINCSSNVLFAEYDNVYISIGTKFHLLQLTGQKNIINSNNIVNCVVSKELRVEPIIEGDTYEWFNSETNNNVIINVSNNDTIYVNIKNKTCEYYVVYDK